LFISRFRSELLLITFHLMEYDEFIFDMKTFQTQ
jgi:hypothetical protein